ncbi:hypothetical protein Tco_1425274, partial [Tanacetum coccineum]
MGNKHDSRRHMGKQVGEGYAFQKKAFFVCGSLSHLIKDYDFHEKRMAQEQAMAKQNEKTNGMGNFNRKWDKMTIWENTQRVDPSNKIVPRAVLLQSGIVDLSSTRPNLSTPVPTGKAVPTSRQNLSTPVTTGRRNLPTPVPTGKAVPAGRPNYPIPVTSGRTNNIVRPFPRVFKPNRPNTQSASPSKRPLHRASPPKTSFSYFGGDKVKTAVKTSAGCSWSSSRHVWKKNTKNNGGSNNYNRLKSKDPLGRPKPGNPHKLTEDLGIVDSGCSRRMTRNMHRLENFQEFKGRNVTFSGGEGKITVLFVSSEDQGERPAEPADQPPIPDPIPSSVNVPSPPIIVLTTTSPPRKGTNIPPSDHDQPSSSRLNEPDEEPLTSTFVEDETAGGSFHDSLPRSHEATSFAGQPLGVAEDPLTLTALSSLVSKFMQ